MDYLERKIIALSLAACPMAASCRESHLDGSSQAAFDASVMRIGSDLSVPDAQELGTGRRAPAHGPHDLQPG
jgi:hypothetical protein